MQDLRQPDFILLDSKGREAYLSQIGNFSPGERRIFHRLVGMWIPVISYNSALAIVSSESATAKNDLHSLMDKLGSARCGLISTHIHNGERVPLGIILCTPHDQAYYARLLEEYLLDVATDLLKPIPTQQLLSENGIQIPDELIVAVDPARLATLHGEKEPSDPAILGLSAGGRVLLFNSGSIKRFVTIALAKLQSILQNPTLLSYFAQKRKQSLIELKTQVEARVPGFWIDFCGEILMAKDVLKQQKKVALDPQFFSLTEFLKDFLTAQKDELLKKKKAEEERRFDMQGIIENLRASPGFFKSEEEFSEILMAFKPKYQTAFTAFRDEFENLFLVPPPKKSLPVIVHLGRAYLHQENVHPFFMMRLEIIGKELFNLYVRQMDQYLKYRDETESAVFYSSANYEADISERVKLLDPALHELLQRPNLVAEAVILSIRKHKEIKGSEDIKHHLSPFFQPERIAFKSLSQLFGLRLQEIYKLAFMRLSLFRQMILRLTGKSVIFEKKFQEISESFIETQERSGRRQNAQGDGDREERRAKLAAEQRSTGKKKSGSGISGTFPKKAATSGTGEKTAAPVEKQNKKYSSSEQDSAWKAFQDSILR